MYHRHKSKKRRTSNTKKRLRSQDWIDILEQLHEIHPFRHDQTIVDHATMITNHVKTKPHIHKRVLAIYKPYGGIKHVFTQAMKMTEGKFSGVGDIISFPFIWFGRNYTTAILRNKSPLYTPFGIVSYAVGLALYLSGIALFSWNVDVFGAYVQQKIKDGVTYVSTKINDAETAIGSAITSEVQALDPYALGIPSKIEGGVVMTAGLAGSLAQQAIVNTPGAISTVASETVDIIENLPEYINSAKKYIRRTAVQQYNNLKNTLKN